MNTDEEIDKKLSEKVETKLQSFEYVASYLNKLSNGYYWLSVIDALRAFPDFKKEIDRIRQKLSIRPDLNIKRLEEATNTKNFKKQYTAYSRGDLLADIDDPSLNKIMIQIAIISEEYPKLDQEIKSLRGLFNKLQQTWWESIKQYIIFDTPAITPVFFRRPPVVTNLVVDNVTGEKYLEIRVYSDSDLAPLKQISWWKDVQKQLDTYCDPKEKDDHILLRRFLYYVLRKHTNFNKNDISKWLESKGFSPVDYQYDNQEIQRFEELFKTN
jgi:hypothetical protein